MKSLLALHGGEVSQDVTFGQQGIAGTPNIWITSITSSFVIRALIAFAGPAGAWAVAGVGICVVLLGSAAVIVWRQGRSVVRP